MKMHFLSIQSQSRHQTIKGAGKSLVSGSLSSTVHYWAWTSTIGYSLYGVKEPHVKMHVLPAQESFCVSLPVSWGGFSGVASP